MPPVNPPKPNALDVQVGGNHYKDMPIQHAEFCQRNKLTWCESAAIKYLCRHRKKNGKEDVLKARHYIDLLLEIEYPPEPKAPVGEPPPGKAPTQWQLKSSETGICGAH